MLENVLNAWLFFFFIIISVWKNNTVNKSKEYFSFPVFKFNACCIINQVSDVKVMCQQLCSVKWANDWTVSYVNQAMSIRLCQSGYVNLCNTVDKIMFLCFSSPLMQHDSFNNTLKLSVKWQKSDFSSLKTSKTRLN